MNAYTDQHLIIVRQIQAERRAEAAAIRRARGMPGGLPAPAARLRLDAARLLVTVVLVALGLGGLTAAGGLLADRLPVDGPAPGFAD